MKRYLIGLIILGSACGKNLNTIPGPVGPQGPKGDKGDNGSSCTVQQNLNGVTVTCQDGSSGIVNNGTNGADAVPCTTTTVAGGVQLSCPDGSQQTILNGTNGTNGTNGSNGTVVTTVQLCSQYNTTYPSSFPEFGFCIDNNLYAVYWDGTHAFEAEIVPGVYSSTSPQTCNFTVLADCVVSQ